MLFPAADEREAEREQVEESIHRQTANNLTLNLHAKDIAQLLAVPRLRALPPLLLPIPKQHIIRLKHFTQLLLPHMV